STEVRSGLVAQPVEILVRTLRNFELEVPDLSSAALDDAPQAQRRAARQVLQWSRLLGQTPGLPPNVGGWPHNEGWLTTDRTAGRLSVGVDIGGALGRADTNLADRFRGAAPAELVALLLRQFGLVDWSDSTAEAAEVAAASEPRGAEAVQAAFALIFTSPEVTLA
ncbi:MAG: DUF1800 family protein, partial [Actinomycetota bacterium]|nr:DUF1800 family protein [Actinomycetota bacterium]